MPCNECQVTVCSFWGNPGRLFCRPSLTCERSIPCPRCVCHVTKGTCSGRILGTFGDFWGLSMGWFAAYHLSLDVRWLAVSTINHGFAGWLKPNDRRHGVPRHRSPALAAYNRSYGVAGQLVGAAGGATSWPALVFAKVKFV